jgi:hypothetical protein
MMLPSASAFVQQQQQQNKGRACPWSPPPLPGGLCLPGLGFRRPPGLARAAAAAAGGMLLFWTVPTCKCCGVHVAL